MTTAEEKTTMTVRRETARLAQKAKHRLEARSLDEAIRTLAERYLADA